MYKYHLKNEFRERLVRLHSFLGNFLLEDSEDGFSCPVNSLWPYLFGVYSYLWRNSVSDCFKKVFKDGNKNL